LERSICFRGEDRTVCCACCCASQMLLILLMDLLVLQIHLLQHLLHRLTR
jgi:hypothetical protein